VALEGAPLDEDESDDELEDESDDPPEVESDEPDDESDDDDPSAEVLEAPATVEDAERASLR